jgi:UDP-N-acetylglucosamine 1-carboxyvinyltransferase
MEKFVIEGGYPLSGTIVPAGNKNAALPALAAALLTEEDVVLRNIPRIRDVEAMLEILRGIGVTVEWLDDNVVQLCAADARPEGLDPELCNRIRASFLIAGPLLARFGRADMPPPGGAGSTRTSTPSARSARASTSTAGSTSPRRPRASGRVTSSWTSRR